jgi:hypothetical protein
MLALHPNCEWCDCDLPNESTLARICTFECTFCAACAEQLQHTCPNCGGELVPRPRRPSAALQRHPAATQRIYNPAAPAVAARLAQVRGARA